MHKPYPVCSILEVRVWYGHHTLSVICACGVSADRASTIHIAPEAGREAIMPTLFGWGWAVAKEKSPGISAVFCKYL